MEQIGESQKQKKIRVSWKNEKVVKTFLEACIQEIEESGRHGRSLKSFSWKKVAEKLKNSHNFVVDQKQMKNHYDYLKFKYRAWSNLKNKAGNAYDPLTNTFNLSEDEWNIVIKANKYVESLKTTSLVFPQLCVQLFDGVVSTKVESRGSSFENSKSFHELLLLEGPEDVNEEPQETSSSKRNCSSSSHDEIEIPTKKAKIFQNSNVLADEEDISKGLKLVFGTNSGPSFKDCKEKLQDLGWGAKNPLHKMALVIFCESATHREAWMHLEPDEVEDWVRMVGHKLRLAA